MIELTNVSRSYGEAKTVLAVSDINLRIGATERAAIIGPSVSGKQEQGL